MVTTKSTLEQFPNELLHYVFSYLQSDEIIYSFLSLNIRFNSLCHHYIEHIDLSMTNSVDKWFTENFQLIPSLIKTLKLNDMQLDLVFESFNDVSTYFTQLKTIHLGIFLQNGHYKQYLPVFKQTISSLLLNYQNATILSRIDHDILNEFITNNAESSILLDTLTIHGVCLSFDGEQFQICQTLKCLTIFIEYQHQLFILLEYLPQLEYLNVGIREGKAAKYDYNYSKTKHLSLKLREFILSANDIHFSDICLLLKQCQSTLEILKIRFKIDYLIDGRMLEPFKRSLKQFYFYFFCHSLDDLSINALDLLSSFQTLAWSHQPVMFFTNSFYQTYTLVSPPRDCQKFNCSLTNEFLNYYLNNRQEELKLPRITRLFLNDKQQPMYTYKFFRLLKTVFTNLQILEVGSSFELHNDNLENDVTLDTVRTLIITNNQDHCVVKHLFKLLPNLYRLAIDYDLLINVTDELYFEQQQDKFQYTPLNEILIHFPPNQHTEITDDLKHKIKFSFKNAKILS
ncbi:unnamed protein product [Didymodactylos carnosus]|uniref:F-box domain-containing protein n=1 Tax=Didymodactylos carnosus TaxID=1234261 RepID=A0A814D5L9_9BILA|nr:unnamed protein product [Didymodactylos carnosus]CAF0949736.1 unnamed protein product [Didymodactylos carnosus]CAF3595339.1 unnamed protein product [Didymodactylos carnosus]CAF3725479.1 unnamed protein product [Didymodactylos carnosus]